MNIKSGLSLYFTINKGISYNFEHWVPVEKKAKEPRINLTFKILYFTINNRNIV